MKLIMIRHGQTELNKNSIVQGRSDYPLNDKGISDALAGAKVLKKHFDKIDIFVSSPSQRALLTTQLVAGKYNHHQKVITDEHFYERDFGPYEGRLVKDVFPIKEFLPGYELDEEIEKRVFQGVKNLFNQYEGKTVLVGCHSHTIKAILTVIAADKYVYSSRLVNGAIFVFDVNNDGIKLIYELNN